jgi:DNA-binding response OmpR family regulator
MTSTHSTHGKELPADQISLLVVDDDVASRGEFFRYLSQEGYQVAAADNGLQALGMIQRERFDLVFLDVDLPGMAGYEVLENLKSDATLSHTLVVMILDVSNVETAARCIEMGADDFLIRPFDPIVLKSRVNICLERKRLHNLESTYLVHVHKEKERAEKLLNVVIPVGVALSAEKDFDRLLEMILLEAKALCDADGGTLYLRTDDDRLRFVMVHNNSLGVAAGGTTGKEITFAPLRLYDDAGAPNHHNVATHVALSGESINIPDAYTAEGFDFSGTKAFDQRMGYHSKSFLTIPLKNNAGRVIGVLQLINAQNPETHEVIAFDDDLRQMIESLSALATVALEVYIREQGLRRQIEQLRIEIDSTRKARQVAEITETDYFKDLQEKARRLRSGGSRDDAARSQNP